MILKAPLPFHLLKLQSGQEIESLNICITRRRVTLCCPRASDSGIDNGYIGLESLEYHGLFEFKDPRVSLVVRY